MSIGTGTHWQNPLLGARAQFEDMPADVLNQRDAWYVFYDFNDPGDGDQGAGANWATATLIGATGTAALVADQPGGVWRITSGAVDNAGVGSIQHNTQACIQPTLADAINGSDRRTIAFGARIAISDFSVSSWFFGLGTVDTTILAATSLLLSTAANNIIGFHHAAEAAAQGGAPGPDGNDLRMVSAGGGIANIQSQLLSTALVPRPVATDAAVDGVFFDYGCRIVGNQIAEFYINGVLRHARRLPVVYGGTINMLPSFAHVCAGGADANMDIDYVWFGATR